MPNWCYNKVKISPLNDEVLEAKLRESVKEDKELFIQFVPQPEFEGDQDWYMWNIENWGTKWDATPTSISWNENEVTFSLDTAWSPPLQFYRALEAQGYYVEATYLEEGMAFVGKYEDGYDEYYEYGSYDTADEMEDNLPDWVNEQFGLVDRKRDEEDDEEWLEQKNIEDAWERTEWYPGKVKPVRDGTYEVKTKSWPWPHKEEWKDGKWVLGNKVTEWRGLTEAQNLALELDNIPNEDIDYDRYNTIIQKFLDSMWRDSDDLNIGEDISDQREIKIIFDGYGDLEDEDENGEYRYTEGGNTNMESYAIFIHKDSGKENFVFPDHDLTPFGLIHRPKEEVCIYAWYDVENNDWSINSLEETSEHEMTDEEVMEILETLDKRYWE